MNDLEMRLGKEITDELEKNNEKPNTKETKYVNKLLSERKRAGVRLREDDMSAVSVGHLCGYQEGINYAMRTFFSIYLGGEE